jgi:hypothetical protein
MNQSIWNVNWNSNSWLQNNTPCFNPIAAKMAKKERKTTSDPRHSCRTIVLWFYILVSDHNATDPVMQKSCNLWRKFICALYWLISPLSSFISIKYIYFLALDIFYDQPVHFIHLYSSLQTNTLASFKFSTIRYAPLSDGSKFNRS